MKTIIDYLDELKEKTGSDYKSVKLLKVSRNTISTIRSRNQCGEDTAIKIADALGVKRAEVLRRSKTRMGKYFQANRHSSKRCNDLYFNDK